MNSEHVEVLRRKLDNIVSGHRINEDDADWLRGLAHKAAIASLSAPAEAQPVAWEARDPDDGTRWVTRSPRERDGWQGLGRTIRPLVYGDTDPPPSAPVGVDEMQRRLDREGSDHGRTIDQRDAAEDALGRMFQAVTGRPAEWSSAWGFVDAVEEVEEHVAALAQQPATEAPVGVGL